MHLSQIQWLCGTTSRRGSMVAATKQRTTSYFFFCWSVWWIFVFYLSNLEFILGSYSLGWCMLIVHKWVYKKVRQIVSQTIVHLAEWWYFVETFVVKIFWLSEAKQSKHYFYFYSSTVIMTVTDCLYEFVCATTNMLCVPSAVWLGHPVFLTRLLLVDHYSLVYEQPTYDTTLHNLGRGCIVKLHICI